MEVLNVLKQLPPEKFRFITNRRKPTKCHPDELVKVLNDIASKYLGFKTDFSVYFEPKNIKGVEDYRRYLKAGSKVERANETFDGVKVWFDDECIPYQNDPNIIGVDVLTNKVKIFHQEKSPVVVAYQGCVGSGKTYTLKALKKELEQKGFSVKYYGVDDMAPDSDKYKYVEHKKYTDKCDVILFDTTCAKGKPEFVDLIFSQQIEDIDGYIALCFKNILSRPNHPSIRLSSAMIEKLELTLQDPYPEMELFELLKSLYSESGYDAMQAFFLRQGFLWIRKVFDEFDVIILSYLEYSQVWTRWGRQARIQILHIKRRRAVVYSSRATTKGNRIVDTWKQISRRKYSELVRQD